MLQFLVLLASAMPFLVGLYAIKLLWEGGRDGPDNPPPPSTPTPPRPFQPKGPGRPHPERRAGDRPPHSPSETYRPSSLRDVSM